jgi:hypothetical protein
LGEYSDRAAAIAPAHLLRPFRRVSFIGVAPSGSSDSPRAGSRDSGRSCKMRRTSDRDDPERGLATALKAMAVVAAVGMLALVAGKSAYTTGAATEVSPTYRMLHSATDVAPAAGVAAKGKIDRPLLATGSAGAANTSPESRNGQAPPGDVRTQGPKRTLPAPSAKNEPVASF